MIVWLRSTVHDRGYRLIEDLPLVYNSILLKLLYPIFQKLSKNYPVIHTTHKMKFSIKDFYSKQDQIHSFLRHIHGRIP